MAINTYFKNIADAIRTKTGGSGLITPVNMPDEILNIPSGVKWLEPIHKNIKGGISNAGFYPSLNGTCNVYQLNETNIYSIVCLGSVAGDCLKINTYNQDPTINGNNGGIFLNVNSPAPYYTYLSKFGSSPFLLVQYSTLNNQNIDIYVQQIKNIIGG